MVTKKILEGYTHYIKFGYLWRKKQEEDNNKKRKRELRLF